MNAEHRGFRITNMVGGLSATVRDAGGYVEVILDGTNDRDELSFDADGWLTLTKEMQVISQLADQVQRQNSPMWESDQ